MRLPLPLENPETLGDPPDAVQEKVAPMTLEVRLIFVVWPEHMAGESGLYNIPGTGKTVKT